MHVTQSAVAVLQVRLEEVRDVTGLFAPVEDVAAQQVEPPAAVASPRRLPLRGEPGGEVRVAGDPPRGEERSRAVEVAGGDRQLLVEGAHRVAESHARIPQRVPHGTGNVLQVTGLAALVDEYDVDVALWRQLAPTVPTYRDESDGTLAAGSVPNGLGEQLAQPVVGDGGQATAELSPAECGVGDRVRPPLEHRGFHRGRLRHTLA